jgi:hypothetical protein
MPSRKLTRSIVVGVAAVAIGAGSYGVVSATTGSSPSTAASGSPTANSGSATANSGSAGGAGSNARTGPEPGGSAGTVSGTSASGFTLTTAGDQKVTITDTSSTTYENGTSPASAGVVTTGQRVLVLGTVNSTAITATLVIAHPPASASTASQVIDFQKGTSGSTKTVGQIPADYTQGQGTIATGTVADKAIEASLTAYPGGVVDRVVELSNGDYEVHNIGVNWPHHVFLNHDFKVIGADD